MHCNAVSNTICHLAAVFGKMPCSVPSPVRFNLALPFVRYPMVELNLDQNSYLARNAYTRCLVCDCNKGKEALNYNDSVLLHM